MADQTKCKKRAKASCKAYRTEGRREINKVKRCAKALMANPACASSVAAIDDRKLYWSRARKELATECPRAAGFVA